MEPLLPAVAEQKPIYSGASWQLSPLSVLACFAFGPFLLTSLAFNDHSWTPGLLHQLLVSCSVLLGMSLYFFLFAEHICNVYLSLWKDWAEKPTKHL